MIAAFSCSVYLIYDIKKNGVRGPLADALITNPTPKQFVNLCETRVKSIRLSSGIELFERGFDWRLKTSEGERIVDPIQVEKWFGRNCYVRTPSIRATTDVEMASAAPKAIFDFVQGGTQTLHAIATGEFVWGRQAFRAPQLEEALTQLQSIKEAGPAGRPRAQGD